MNLGTAKRSARVVIDTNVLISALGFGGKPREILILATLRKIQAVTSAVLLAELQEVINKKFPILEPKLDLIVKKITRKFILVHPKTILKVLRDEDDNRVLEASLTGKCDYIITGDEAPAGLRPGYLLPSAQWERNPSEAENFSHSSMGLRPGFSAKGDKDLLDLATFKGIKILTPKQFLEEFCA
ncbi:MAG: putative toxin-antitoxin system toxin component, PIN family [Candidatus Daviesbacteria bacterium]|nr:putative toxin-antitoxin system toxin component, PIN family [Candidatus Daviesbacteria bacterium]